MIRIKFQDSIALVLFIIQSSITFSQDYIPMNFNDGVWDEYFTEPPPGNSEEITKFCCGDTTIGNLMYYKLYEEKLVEPYLGDHYYTPSSLIGFIRNSENRTVQYIPKGEKDPVTIYNFNVSLGDTIYGVNQWEYFVVKVIDSVEIAGRYHKRYSEFGFGYPDNPCGFLR